MNSKKTVIVDTCTLSRICHPNNKNFQNEKDIFRNLLTNQNISVVVSIIADHESRRQILVNMKTKDTTRKLFNQFKIDRLNNYDSILLNLTKEDFHTASEIWADLQTKGLALSRESDILIAAQARNINGAVYTENTKDFAICGVENFYTENFFEFISTIKSDVKL